MKGGKKGKLQRDYERGRKDRARGRRRRMEDIGVRNKIVTQWVKKNETDEGGGGWRITKN